MEGLCSYPSEPPLVGFCFHYPFPCLVFKEWLDERVQGMNVPGLVDKMDSSKAGRKAVLGGKRETHSDQHASQVSRGPSRTASWRACCFSGIEISANGGRERKHTYLPFVKVPSVPSCLCSPATPQLSCIRPVTSESQLCDH